MVVQLSLKYVHPHVHPDVHEAGLKLMAALHGCDTDLNQERVTLFIDLINLIPSMQRQK